MVLEKILFNWPTTKQFYGGHISCMIGKKYRNFVQNLNTSFLQSSNSQSILVSEEQILTNQKQELLIEDLPQMLRIQIFRNRPTRNKNCLLRPCLFINLDDISNLNRGSALDTSYHVSVNLTKRFQRRRMFQKLTKHKQELHMAAMFINGLGRNEQIYRGGPPIDLPSFS